MKMKQISFSMLAFALMAVACKEKPKENTGEPEAVVQTEAVANKNMDVTITPIEHASAVLTFGDTVVYIDPVGGIAKFEGQPSPNLVLITDIHGDHMDPATLEELNTEEMTIVAPKAVADQLPQDLASKTQIMANGDTKEIAGMTIQAIPMYNLRPEALKFHEKGRGNGYVLTIGDQRIYFSGDTEDIPEMRALQNIDQAFICMNLPYTMTVEKAANAVLEFKPKKVYPYHYRGNPDVADVAKFKALVNAGDPNIEVIQWDWYPNDDF